MNPAIIIIAFNRPVSLKRLLNSILNANYSYNNIPLVISIDFEHTKENKQVKIIADEFEWEYGQKTVIKHKHNLGLRNHVLECGDLTIKFESIIMLEDDLYVSPEFYNYAINALDFYAKDDRIAGISLYNHKTNFLCFLPFQTFIDQYDNYFLQIASSWGQAWSEKQWSSFRIWYSKGDYNWENIPEQIKNWPETSWLKYYINYLIFTGKYFVYPRRSFSTNFSDGGSHNKLSSPEWQVPIVHNLDMIRFSNIDKSLAVYDSFFEMIPEKLKKIIPKLSNYDLEIDFYGQKKICSISAEYWITSKNTIKPIKKYSLNLKPIELNLLHESTNGELALVNKEFLISKTNMDVSVLGVFSYFYGPFRFKKLVELVWHKLKSKFFSR